MDSAREVVRGYAERAKRIVEPLAEGAAKEALRGLCDVVISRTA
jgi:heptaprenyl diphosphate synthase